MECENGCIIGGRTTSYGAEISGDRRPCLSDGGSPRGVAALRMTLENEVLR